MRIYREYEVPRGVVTKVVPNGFFGDMMIAMQPTAAVEGVHAVGDTLVGEKSVGVADVVSTVDSIGRDIRQLTQALRSELIDAGGLRDLRRTVSSANASEAFNPDVGSCVVGVVRRLRFPAPEGGSVTYAFPFIFEPAN